jgi:hypothetical protein
MPSSAPQIPTEAVEALAKTRWERARLGDSTEPQWSALGEVRQRASLARAADDLEAAYPHLLAAFKKEQSGDGLTVHMSGRTAISLRYILPLVAESLRLAPETKGREGETFAMLEEAVADIDRALPPELRGAIDDHYIAEKRMDAIDAQRAAGVRPLADTTKEGTPDAT